jgi:hypothetical protein
MLSKSEIALEENCNVKETNSRAEPKMKSIFCWTSSLATAVPLSSKETAITFSEVSFIQPTPIEKANPLARPITRANRCRKSPSVIISPGIKKF